MGSKEDYEHLNKRVSQERRRRKEADATIEADAAERDARVLKQAKQYTDEQVAEVRKDLGIKPRLRAVND